jgi:site-specific DNA recombinase
VNPWTGEEVQGIHEPMITKEEYFKIQSILSGKSNRVKRIRKNPNFLLRQTVKCGHCGQPLTGSCSQLVKRRKYYYYHCFNKECSMYGKAISKQKLENDFVEYLKEDYTEKRFFGCIQGNSFEFVEQTRFRLKNRSPKL